MPYPMYPLAIAPPPPERQGMDPLLKALAVALAIAVVLYLIDRMTRERADAEPVKPNPGKKMSTRDMAKKLYERLEKNGDVNDTTMRSLAQLGRRRSTTT